VDSLERARNALVLAVRLAGGTDAQVRSVHQRIWDRMPRAGGRLYLESGLEATATLSYVWGTGALASGIVVDAPRAGLATAVLHEASDWGADAFVLTLCPRRIAMIGL
jgi:hypothetical protein